MLGFHDVISREAFIQWIDEQLTQLNEDDQLHVDHMDGRYGDIHSNAQIFAGRLGLHEVVEALGVGPPPFVGGDEHVYFTGVRNLIRTKLLRIRPLLGSASAKPSEKQTNDVALDDATMAQARANLAHLQSLASANTTIQSWVIWPPGKNVTFGSDSTPVANADDLTPRERITLEALGVKTLQAQELADAAGYPNNSSFRSMLSNLVKRNHLKKSPDGDGYSRCQ